MRRLWRLDHITAAWREWVLPTDPTLQVAFGYALIAVVVDVALTQRMVVAGPATEIGPGAGVALGSYGWPGLLALELAGVLVCFASVMWLRARDAPLAWLLAGLFVGVLGWNVIHNLALALEVGAL